MNPQLPPPASVADPRQQVLSQIKSSTNVLLTVSENPNVDQLASVIGMTLLLNKLGKHATAVFSGQVPSVIEFLHPEKTIEKTTDSLRDFIIALDKSKADKLRYKIEDKYVKIFITPYHTSLSQKDLEYSEGDYNVDLILALGVKKRDDIDSTIVQHGRILHDATVISINNVPGADLGAINWVQNNASSLSEMLVVLADDLKTDDNKLFDQQIATCFLTGIVSQTDRFSNAKTTPQTMSLAAKLMNAGANQQLIATKLQSPVPIPQVPNNNDKPPSPPASQSPATPPKPPGSPAPPHLQQPPAGPPRVQSGNAKTDTEQIADETVQDGALLVPHEGVTGDGISYNTDETETDISKIHIDDQGTLKRVTDQEVSNPLVDKPKFDALPAQPAVTESAPAATTMNLPPINAPAVPPPSNPLPLSNESHNTLSDLEKSVNSPHVHAVDKVSDLDLPINIIGPDKGLPTDLTAGSPNPLPPPPVPPPIPMAVPGSDSSAPGSNIPL